MRRIAIALGFILMAVPAGSWADHDPPHDPRHNPNCAWDSSRSADYNGDGEPDHMVAGVSHNTSFPRQFVELVWGPVTGQDSLPPFFGQYDAHDDATVVVQGDHRMLGANPAHTEEGDPEQLHNGAIYAHVDYDEVEDGRTPRADIGAGIYEANHLVMFCGSTDGDPQYALCPNGSEVVKDTDEPCPLD